MYKTFFIETYGCQMNFADSEIVHSILVNVGYVPTMEIRKADFVFINTCSIRDHAEQRVLNRLQEVQSLKKKRPHLIIGILGCMAERLQKQLIEKNKNVDLVVGPDAYRRLPEMLNSLSTQDKAIDTLLSTEETYSDIEPIRLSSNRVSAFIAIMRGCENYCAYCVVPYTRGRERSREARTIIHEAQVLFDQGYREVTLLGQNVNSYRCDTVDFADLLALTAQINPLLRVRFATSHPKDLSDKLLETMAQYPNICRSIHLPIQSGSDTILQKMNRKYTLAWYKDRIAAIRRYLPDCSLSTDIIVGFCDETEQDYKDTLSLMQEVGYASAFMFKYSERPDTYAAKHYADNIPEDVKSQRLAHVIDFQQQSSLLSNQRDIGQTFEVLVEGVSKRSTTQYIGRNSQNKVVIFSHTDEKPGDYIYVRITDCSAVTLFGQRIE
ncbi:tRNA-2-methylthio-N(6)-dimethylallyladenosine synthase [Bacteroidia bacterium]|nr:tRNA-2-methylthio-N(6)-dimethylallyladenosine synthase [Bacteroidia bacterium]